MTILLEHLPLTVGVALLILTALPVALSGNRTIQARWASWVGIGVVAGFAEMSGINGAALLAASISVICAFEFRKLVGLHRSDLVLLLAAGMLFPLVSVLNPGLLPLYFPYALLAAAVLPLFGQDTTAGAGRSAYLAFGILWLAWAPAQLVAVHDHLLVIVLAVALTDVASWAAGKSLGHLPFLRIHPFAVSPNKTVAGLLGGAAAAALTLTGIGAFTVPLFLAVAVGAPLGDLTASMVKRHAGVKDAGAWLPGFGGLLDRADSLLVVAPLAAAVFAFA